jgi:L-asparaginase
VPRHRGFEIVVRRVALPAVIVHGGAGAYLRTTTRAQRLARGRALAEVARHAHALLVGPEGSARAAVLDAAARLERDERFNAGLGARLQRDGRCRLSAAIADGRSLRLSAVYNVQECLHPSALASALQLRGDRNLDGEGARLLMRELGVDATDVRTPHAIQRWRELGRAGDAADREGAVGRAGARSAARARRAKLPLPRDLRGDRHGTIGAVAAAEDGDIWAVTSTGGRGHEAPGRISDSPTPAGTYACAAVGLSATGFGEQIIDLNLCGRIATRVLDGAGLRAALARTFAEVARTGALCGVIALTTDGRAGYAYSTEACGVAWCDARGNVHIDRHGR